MPQISFQALPTAAVRAVQAGGLDAYGLPPERHIAEGPGIPCRHCLTEVAAGEPYLILAYRPFEQLQPYAETGPIFLHASDCVRHAETSDTPAMFLAWERLLLKGYSADQRIVYGTGQVVPAAEVAAAAGHILAQPNVAFVDLRSARNNCFQARVVKA
jgi:Protein of unknown function (DUF1203)